MDQHEPSGRHLRLLSLLNDELIKMGRHTEIRHDIAALSLHTQEGRSLYVFVDDDGFFSWQHPDRRLRVGDVPSAARAFVEQADADPRASQ
ncbi:hypothetical protein J5X84_40370 [Streptosporangiaceae bacterium NEAU-GS5]|nr:hypothetical protein [Streptosporangiaceae bacterium NEAU-GS5]